MDTIQHEKHSPDARFEDIWSSGLCSIQVSLHFQDTIFVGGLRKSTTEDCARNRPPNSGSRYHGNCRKLVKLETLLLRNSPVQGSCLVIGQFKSAILRCRVLYVDCCALEIAHCLAVSWGPLRHECAHLCPKFWFLQVVCKVVSAGQSGRALCQVWTGWILEGRLNLPVFPPSQQLNGRMTIPNVADNLRISKFTWLQIQESPIFQSSHFAFKS